MVLIIPDRYPFPIIVIIIPYIFKNATPITTYVHERKINVSISRFFTPLLVMLSLWLSIRYLLPIAMPFLLAGLLALAAEPLVTFFYKKVGLPRPAATGIGMTMVLVLLILGIMVLVALLLRELGLLASVVPDLADTAVEGLSLLEGRLLGLVSRAPGNMGIMLQQSVEGFFSDGTALLDRTTAWLLGLAGGIVKALPDSALGLFTWLLSCYMLSAKLPVLKDWLRRHLPPVWNEKYRPMLHRLKGALGGWLKAQAKLLAITFLVLTIGLFLLQVPYAPLWALVIAFVDALPVLGSGMVLVPWSIVCFLQGESVRGIGLLGIYAAACLLRSILEPRFVGKQLGLDPLVTLAAIYVGYRLLGLGGMLLAPLLAVLLTQLFAAPQEG